MEVKIGIHSVPRELGVETDTPAEEVERLLSAALPGLDGITLASLATAAFLPFTPLIFRYSRTLWIHFERAGSPSGQSATAYEKARLRELALRGEGDPGSRRPASADPNGGPAPGSQKTGEQDRPE